MISAYKKSRITGNEMRSIIKILITALVLIANLAYSQDELANLKQSAEQGSAESQYQLALFYYQEENYKDAVRWLEKSAKQGVVAAQIYIGWMHEIGVGVRKNLRTAVRWYQAAADQGDVNGQYNLGVMYENGTGVRKNLEEATRYYELAIAQGHIGAMNNRAAISRKLGGTTNGRFAVALFYRAAVAGDAVALQNLESMASEKNNRYTEHFDASDRLGDLYMEIHNDPRTALNYYQQNLEYYLASNRSMQSTLNHGALLSGITSKFYFYVPDRELVAFNLLEKVALCSSCSEQLKGEANYYLALLYDPVRVERTTDSLKKYVDYLNISLSHGNAYAALQLGKLYDRGELVDPDLDRARVLYETALNWGDSEAAELLANVDTRIADRNEVRRQEAEQRLAAARTAERAEEERRRFLASSEGQRQLAEKAEQERQQQTERQQAIQEENERRAREYPYYAVVSCSFSGQHINILACFSGTIDTELVLQNDSDYRLYKVYEIHQAGVEGRDGLVIDLRESFSLRVQNANDTLVLGVRIYDRRTGSVVAQKQEGKYGIISFRN